MAAGAYMGAAQVQALLGRWSEIVGAAQQGRRGQYGRVGAEVTMGPGPVHAGHRHHHHRHHHHKPWWEVEREQQYERDQRYERPYQYGNQVGSLPWHEIVGSTPLSYAEDAGFPPRNALIDAPGPQRAGREVLPMSVDGPILPGQSAQITARPQRVAFRPERVFISAASDATLGAAAWLVNDIKIGNRSQFSQSGSIPGDMFATTAIDSFVSFETAQTAMDVVMVVTYIGSNSDGVSFYGAIIGTAAI